MTLPPPIATTTSAPCSRAAAPPALASSTVGSAGTGNTSAGTPSPASSPACRAGSLPVHTSARVPSPASTPGSSAARPAPKSTRPAVLNSNLTARRSGCPRGRPRPTWVSRCAARPAGVVRREHRGEPGGPPGLGHHLGDRVPPGRVVRRLLVRGRGLLVAVDLGQHHVPGVGLVLQHVEPQHARLGERRPRVDQRRGEEIRGLLRPDPDMYMNDQHVPILPHARSGTQPRAGQSTTDRSANKSLKSFYPERAISLSKRACGVVR